MRYITLTILLLTMVSCSNKEQKSETKVDRSAHSLGRLIKDFEKNVEEELPILVSAFNYDWIKETGFIVEQKQQTLKLEKLLLDNSDTIKSLLPEDSQLVFQITTLQQEYMYHWGGMGLIGEAGRLANGKVLSICDPVITVILQGSEYQNIDLQPTPVFDDFRLLRKMFTFAGSWERQCRDFMKTYVKKIRFGAPKNLAMNGAKYSGFQRERFRVLENSNFDSIILDHRIKAKTNASFEYFDQQLNLANKYFIEGMKKASQIVENHAERINDDPEISGVSFILKEKDANNPGFALELQENGFLHIDLSHDGVVAEVGKKVGK